MKDVELLGSQILVSNDVEEGIVGIYAGLAGRNVAGIHRVILANIHEILALKMSQCVTSRDEDGARRLEVMQQCSHIILEGNHRAAAYALLGKKIPCTVLENDTDVRECIALSDTGEMGRFVHEEPSLARLVEEAMRYPLTRIYGPVSASMYVKQAVKDHQFEIKAWPKYLRDQVAMPAATNE